MKNYCNRRRPKQQNKPQNIIYNLDKKNDDIILPPAASSTILNTDTYADYAQGGAYSQEAGYAKEILENRTDIYSIPKQNDENIYLDKKSGQFDFLSIPKERNELSTKSMASFLDKYIGKLICLDLWTTENGREELCGVLIETGKNYIVINIHETDNIILIDLRTIRYVSIFCR